MFPNSSYILNPGTPVQNLSPHKNPHTNVYNSFHHSCQNMEATKMSFNRWMVKKLWYIHTMEYHSVIKRNELPSHKIWRNLKCILLSERKLSRKAPCCMIPTPWHSEESKTMETVKRSVVARASGKRRKDEREEPGDLQGRETIGYDAAQWIHVIRHLSKPTKL